MIEGGRIKMELGSLERVLRLLAIKWNTTPEDCIRRLVAKAGASELDRAPIRTDTKRPYVR